MLVRDDYFFSINTKLCNSTSVLEKNNNVISCMINELTLPNGETGYVHLTIFF
jgi:hypothetical protein